MVDLGANACIVGRNVQKTEAAACDIATARKGAKVIGIGAVDVRSKDSLAKAVEKCAKELGGIDIVIAGAAGNFLAPLTQLSENAFKAVIDIDVLGSYNTVKATLPELIRSAERAKANKTPGPRLLFISATLHYTGIPLQTHVIAAKAAIDALSVNCSIELGPRGITSNVIAPGGIADTEGMDRLSKVEHRGESAKRSPMGRLGTIKDCADAAVWLCSAAANFINGTVVVGEFDYHYLSHSHPSLTEPPLVDGGSWRTMSGSPGGGFNYPDFLLADEVVSGVKGMKKEKSKL